MRVETKEFMNEFTTGEKYAIKTLKFVGENPEKDKKTMRKQDTIRDKITKEFPLTVETTNFHEEEYNEINNTAVESRKPIMETPTIEKIFSKNREMEGTLEYYRKLIKEKDKINQITEESLKNNRNILQKSERTNLELIKYLQNEKIKIKNQQEGRLIPSGKVYITQKELERPFVPHPAVHKHYSLRRIVGIDSKYLRKDGILTLEIPKYRRLKMRENYFKKIEIFTLQIPTRKDRKPQMRENTKETDTNWCEDKFKKEMVLNYTERGKQQEQQKLFILYLLYSTLLQYFITFYYYFTLLLLITLLAPHGAQAVIAFTHYYY